MNRPTHEGATAVQDRPHFAAFDVKTKDRAELIQLRRDGTRAAERMTAGREVGEGARDGSDGLGRLEAGLLFLAHQRDDRTGLIPVRTSLARNDALDEYTQHVGSAIFAIPPVVRTTDDRWGRELFA
ncbi:deferrochelatase/peroxidase EfeB [Streptomyces sp. CG 926]|nr:deferrochelatase/peroxidase EfeB [Streptomyces sp. CG 926]